jgi:hypothetical protein
MSLFQQICKILDGVVDEDIKAELLIFTRIIVIYHPCITANW